MIGWGFRDRVRVVDDREGAAEGRRDGSEGVRDDRGPQPLSRMRPVDHAR
jgi:hypothetical protein